MGKAINDELPTSMKNESIDMLLFDFLGIIVGCTTSCDLDHNGKITFERAKIVTCGMNMHNFRFSDSDHINYLMHFGIFRSNEDVY